MLKKSRHNEKLLEESGVNNKTKDLETKSLPDGFLTVSTEYRGLDMGQG